MTRKENEPPTDKAREATDIAGDNHATLHWSFCYDDYCKVHNSAKDAAGYYPRKPRNKEVTKQDKLNKETGEPTIRSSLESIKERKEFNMMSRQPLQQLRDDGNHARGRSPPRLQWEDATLQENEPPSYDDTMDGGNLDETDDSPEEGEIAETPDESNSEEEGYTDDDQPADDEILHFSVDGPEPIRRMVLHMARKFEEVFPKVSGKRRLHPQQFDQMLAQLRAMFWNYRLLDVEYDARDYVKEVPPIGSQFGPNGSYLTPDGVLINKEMRDRVKIIAKRYQEIQKIQELFHDDNITWEEAKKQIEKSLSQWTLPPTGSPLPVWRGMLLGHIRAEIKGQVVSRMTQGKIILKPRTGPLEWEVCLMDANCPDYFSKNY